VKIRHFIPLIFLSLLPAINAATLSVTVHDPSGAIVQGATISIQPAKGGATATLSTGPTGTITANDLAPGDYRLTVDKSGFAHSEQTIALTDAAAQTLIVELKIATQESTIGVQANSKSKISPLANSDPNYRLLRGAQPTEGRQVANLILKRDTGTFTFTTGVFTFLTPVMGKTVYAVFSGDATFHLKPVIAVEANYMKLLSGSDEADEAFSSAVFCFTDATAAEIRAGSQLVQPAPAAGLAWREFRDRTRNSIETPRSMLESLLGYDDMENMDADLLSDLYTPSRTRFLAYMHGKKHDDLRFLVNESGAVSALRSPEEVALIDYDPGGDHEGIWYMSHLQSEWEKHAASSDEDRHWARALSFHIDTAIGTNNHLAATADIRLKALVDGVRVIKFGLLPSLRVSSVRLGNTEIPYIQEDRRHDGYFYVIFPQALRAGADAEITVSYEGDKVIRDEGNGNFSVGARESWYPSLNSFVDRATYDLTFRVPKRYTLVSVGNPVESHVDHDTLISHWVSEIPLAVAGFNYGDFAKFSRTDETSHNVFEAYATHEAPAYLARSAISPTAMAKNMLVDAENAVRTYEYYFGTLPYGRLAITQQPQFNFGQSWPTLIYLPVSAFLDDTQRWMLMQGQAFRFNDFITEVTPHEVSHQWWGHAVGWATYRDQWLSEGFATFSAGLFLQNTVKGDAYEKYWEAERKRLTDKNEYGLRAGEAIPLWMGLRLDTFRTERFYNDATYSKGAFVLHMLRSLMWDSQTHDQDFIDMMKDFVKTYYNRDPSTEDFMAIASKHMKPGMDLAGDHRMMWFFQQWVYGTSMPKYRFEYSLKDEPEGKVRLTGTLTQSNVTETFRMKVPVYADFDGTGYVRLGQLFVAGNQAGQPFSVVLPKRPQKVSANQFNDVLAIETVNAQVH
jgi:hypothetical protein